MPLKVIGSGLGRTGTMSLKGALEHIGFGPCHHMVEVFMNPESLAWWIAAGEGNPDWDRIFADFTAMVDYPGCIFYRQLADHFPDAKVLHSTRDSDEWFDSTQATIFSPGSPVTNAEGPMRRFFDVLFISRFGDRIHDRRFMTEYFRRHEAEVLASIPPERLLVFRATDGWAPLCGFLGVPVPPEPYPRTNTREAFIGRNARANDGAPMDPEKIRAYLKMESGLG
jgi:sulfotransferase family protein